MKKVNYVAPEMAIVIFDTADILTGSIGGSGDGGGGGVNLPIDPANDNSYVSII